MSTHLNMDIYEDACELEELADGLTDLKTKVETADDASVLNRAISVIRQIANEAC